MPNKCAITIRSTHRTVYQAAIYPSLHFWYRFRVGQWTKWKQQSTNSERTTKANTSVDIPKTVAVKPRRRGNWQNVDRVDLTLLWIGSPLSHANAWRVSCQQNIISGELLSAKCTESKSMVILVHRYIFLVDIARWMARKSARTKRCTKFCLWKLLQANISSHDPSRHPTLQRQRDPATTSTGALEMSSNALQVWTQCTVLLSTASVSRKKKKAQYILQANRETRTLAHTGEASCRP